MALAERCGRTALALLLAASLAGISSAWAGPGDEPPPPPGGAQPVVAGPGHEAGRVAIPSGGGAAEATRAAVEDRLTASDVQPRFRLGGREVTARQLLDATSQQASALAALKAELDRDIEIAGRRLAVDKTTRNALRALDEKYVPLQAALTLDGQHGRAPIAVFEKPEGPAEALRAIYDDPSVEPRRFGFVSRVFPGNSHWVAGDLYVDKAKGEVSLVVWDSVQTFSLDYVSLKMRQVIDDKAPDGQRTLFVTSHHGTNVQSIETGCSQCSLSFLDEMRKLDLHSEQIDELRAALADGAPPLPDTHKRETKGSIDVLSITRRDTSALPDPVLELTNARSKLIDTLAARVEALLAAREAGSIDAAQYEEGLASTRELLRSVQGDRVPRILDSNRFRIEDRRPVEVPGTEKLFNLRIDRLRARDLRAIRARLDDDPEAFLRAARDLNQEVVDDAVAEGREQRRRLEQGEPEHPTADSVADEQVLAEHEAAASSTAHDERAPALDDEALLAAAEEDDAPFMPIAAPAEQDVDVDEDHEAALSLEDRARGMVEVMFAEVERDARQEEERRADRASDDDDNRESRREAGRAL